MNNKRREEIRNAVKNLNYIKDEFEHILRDEEYAYDSIPENLQNSLRASDSEDAIDSLENVIDLINEAIETMDII